jgi:hypothetical protein
MIKLAEPDMTPDFIEFWKKDNIEGHIFTIAIIGICIAISILPSLSGVTVISYDN